MEQAGTAGQQTGFDNGGLHRDVADGLLQALFAGSHAMAGFEAEVTKQADQLLQLRCQHAVGWLGQQDQQIDIGCRVQLTSAIAADRDQGKRRRQAQLAPQLAEDFVDQSAALLQQVDSVTLGDELFADRPLSLMLSLIHI